MVPGNLDRGSADGPGGPVDENGFPGPRLRAQDQRFVRREERDSQRCAL